MEQENLKEAKIPISVKRLLEKRDALISKNEDELSKIEEDGIITKREARRISRNSRDIQNFDTRLQRSGFIPAQTLLPTSKTTQIALPQGQFEQSSAFNVPPRRIGGGGTVSTDHPFKISFTAPNAITVNAGTINNVVAGNWDELFSFSQTIYVVLTVNAVSNRIVSSVLGVQDSPPAGEESPVKWGTPSQFKVLLGIVINNKIFQIVFNNLSYNALKRITTDRQNPQAGLLPYDNWYTWVKISG
jgi:hypothetical protein